MSLQDWENVSQEWKKIAQDLSAARERMENRHWRPDLFGLPFSKFTVTRTLTNVESRNPDTLDLTPEDIKWLIAIGVNPTQ